MIKKILILLLTIITVFSLILFGCGRIEPAAEKATEAEEVEPEEEVQVEVTFTTEDGIKINGNIFGSGNRWVILSHMYPANQTNWFDTADFLSINGFIVLTFDFRGYSKSEGEKEISKIYIDLETAVDFINQYDVKKLFLIGASMGGTASIIAAAEKKVDGVITISAPLEFEGLDAGSSLEKLTCAKLFIASEGDTFAEESANKFYEKTSEPKEVEILDGKSHGTNIFTEEPQNGEKLKELILEFLNKY